MSDANASGFPDDTIQTMVRLARAAEAVAALLQISVPAAMEVYLRVINIAQRQLVADASPTALDRAVMDQIVASAARLVQ